MTTLAELTTPYTPDEVKARIYDGIAAAGVSTTTWKPGAVVRTVIAVVAYVLAAFSTLVSLITKGGFLDEAEGAWLTLVAYYVYGVTRDPGSFATGTWTAANSTGNNYNIAVGDLVVLNTTTKKQYRNTAAVTIGAHASGVAVAIQAIEQGSASSSSPSAITELVTVYAGVTGTNATALVGMDEQNDASLRALCRDKTGALSPNGPPDAYSYIAKTTKRATGASIGITRVKTVPDGIGGIDAYLATASGSVSGTVGDTATDLGLVDSKLQAWSLPRAITLRTHTATPKSIAITYTLWYRQGSSSSGLTPSQVQDAVASKLGTYLAAAPIGGETFGGGGGKVYVSALETVIGNAVPEPLRVVVTLPAADVDIAGTEAPVLGTITPTATPVVEAA